MKKVFLVPATSFFCCTVFFVAKAQVSLTGQLRTRTELRDGAGTLKPSGNKSSFFTSQRARLAFNYKSGKVIFHTSLQDVRVWGQDASTISNADGSRLEVHEAWAEIITANKKDGAFKKPGIDYFGIKVGRQELMYDDSRLLGNLDWLQQARRHDAIVFKLLNKGWQADAGFAFNQNTDAFNYNGTYYTPANVSPYVKDSKGNLAITPAGFIPLTLATGISAKSGNPSFINIPGTNGMYQNYKSMQFLYVAKKVNQTKISGLFLADEFGKYILDSVKNIAGTDTGYVYGKKFNQTGVNARVTTGMMVTSLFGRKNAWYLAAGAYYQGGTDKDGLMLSAFMSTFNISYTGKKLTYTAGWDYLSGNDAFSASATNHRFDPLYGTPHKFWGYMDYFYAGTGSPTGGLSNPFFKLKYVVKNFTAGLDYHYFSLANNQKDISGKAIKKYLGSELDFVAAYDINKLTTVEWGLSYMGATRSMEYAKGITPGTANLNGYWSYLQINIRPDFFAK